MKRFFLTSKGFLLFSAVPASREVKGKKISRKIRDIYHSVLQLIYKLPDYQIQISSVMLLSYFFDSENKNSNPPSGLFLTEISPLWSKTAFFTIERPKPVPPFSRERP